MVDPQISPDVNQEPEPLSPSNRNRVPTPSSTSRSHNVKYEPGSHIARKVAGARDKRAMAGSAAKNRSPRRDS